MSNLLNASSDPPDSSKPSGPCGPSAASRSTSDSSVLSGNPLRVGHKSHLTLHYRLTLSGTDADVFNTFEGKPATLQLGIGQMAEPLERQLLGMEEGADRVFDLDPDDAFGPRNPDLLQRVSRALLADHSRSDGDISPGDVVEFSAPDGGRFAGVLKEIDEQGALFDFNHPLAGQRIRFAVRLLGIL